MRSGSSDLRMPACAAAMSSTNDRRVSLSMAGTIFVLDVAATNMRCCSLRLFDRHKDHIRGASKARTRRKPVKDVVSIHRAVALWEQSSQVQILPPGPILNRYLAALSSHGNIGTK